MKQNTLISNYDDEFELNVPLEKCIIHCKYYLALEKLTVNFIFNLHC